MADKSDQVNQWIRRIEDAEKLRDQFKDSAEKNYKAIYGDDWIQNGQRGGTDTATNRDSQKYQLDKLLSYIKTEIPSLVLYRPEVFLTATEESIAVDPTSEQSAKQYQDETNTLLNDMDGFEIEIKTALIDAHCFFGVTKNLHDPVIGKNPNAGQVITDPQTGEPISEPQEIHDDSKFDICRVDPFKFLIDKRCKNDPSKARWKGEEIDRTLDEITESGLYDPKAIDKLREQMQDKDKEDWEIDVKIYEIYDSGEDKLIVIAKELKDEFLRYDDIPSGIDGDPYNILKFNEIPGQFYPKPEITSGQQFQTDETEIRKWLKNTAKKSVPKLGVKNNVDPNEEKKLHDGVSDTVKLNSESDVWVINNDIKEGSAVNAYAVTIQRDFDEIMGQSSQDRGIVGEAKFATEANIAEQKGTVREQDKLNTVRVWLESIIKKLIKQIKEGGYAQLKGLNLDVDLDIEIDIESKTPKNKAIDRKQLTEVLNIIAQNPMFVQSPTLLEQIFKDYDIRDHKKIIAELQQAVQAQMQAQQPQPTPTPQPEGPRLGVNISFKGEMLPIPVADKILDLAFKTDIPMQNAASFTPSAPGTPTQGQATSPESVGSGTEGMSPGSGQVMPNTGVM